MDWLPEKYLVFFLLDISTKENFKEIYAVYGQKDPRGEKAYDP